MKSYGQMRFMIRFREGSIIEKAEERTIDILKQSNLIELSEDRAIFFKSIHKDGTIIKIPFICEVSDYHSYPFDIAKAVCANANFAWSRNYKDVLTGRSFICHEELITSLDRKIYSSGKSNLGEYFNVDKFYKSEEVIQSFENLTKEDVLTYIAGIEELQSIIRKSFSDVYITAKKKQKDDNKAVRKREKYISNIGKNILR